MQASKEQPQIIVYGGTFDPPHTGHADCLKLALHRFPKAEVLVMPAFSPAGASGMHKTPQSSYLQRLELCELAFCHLSPRLSISRIEQHLPQPNYTVQTLQRLSQEFPGKKLGLLIGGDQLASFDRWHKPLEILKLSSLLVVSRLSPAPGEDADRDLSSTFAALAEKLEQAYEWHTDKDGATLLPQGNSVYLFEEKICPAASRIIRSLLAAGKELPSGWLLPSIQQRILELGLYQDKDTTGV